jgi:hypothetical protein
MGPNERRFARFPEDERGLRRNFHLITGAIAIRLDQERAARNKSCSPNLPFTGLADAHNISVKNSADFPSTGFNCSIN